MIRINNKEIQYKEKMSVKEALKLSGESIDTMDIVVVNGVIISKMDLSSTIISDNSEIQLFPLISGG